ncbi:MAG TPA: FtsX-like permease family protein, partial [Bryobacteraceae bacterium]|nr:FtsX-like permease family protein [Bryobacteraceae bacterium]
GLAYAALKLLVAIGPANLPRIDEISIDARVLLFTLALSLAAGAAFGLIPVFRYAGPRLMWTLRQGGRNASGSRDRHRARSVLVVLQVALALVLLIGSGLMIRTVRALKQVQPGFTRPEQILTAAVSIPDALVPKPEQAVRAYNNILDKIAAIPGVTSVGLTNSITMDGNTDNDPILAADKSYAPGQIPPMRRYKFISPGYFKSMGNPILAGRDLTWTDIYETRRVVVVSEAMARELWHDPGAALGKQVRENPQSVWREVVGVVGNERDDGVNKKATTMVYWPLLLRDFWGQPLNAQRGEILAIRSARTGSASLMDEVRRAVWSVNPDLPIANVRTVREVYDRSMARTSFTLVMLSIAAGMALLLGIVGIYGVICYTVAQRTREIGIRIALGAPKQSVLRMFVQQGLMLTAIGVLCGVVAAAALTRMMTALLFDVSALDPVTYVATSLVLAAAAVVASYVPARRAAGIEPVEALRAE